MNALEYLLIYIYSTYSINLTLNNTLMAFNILTLSPLNSCMAMLHLCFLEIFPHWP